MKRMTKVVVMVVRFWFDSVYVLTKDTAVIGELQRQYIPYNSWLHMFGCSNGWRSAITQL